MRSISIQGRQHGQRDDLTLLEVWHVLRSRWRLVLGTIVVFVLASVIYSLLQERVYTAEATIAVTSQGEEVGVVQDAESSLQEIEGAVSTDEMLAEAMRRAGWESERSFEQRLEVRHFVRQDGQESGFEVRFSAPEPQEAAQVANAYATLFVDRVGRLNGRLAGGTLAAAADVEDRAVAPDHPSSPRPLIYATLALVAGLVAGGAAALLLDSRTRSWRGARDAEMTLRAPVLGVIPEYSRDGGEV